MRFIVVAVLIGFAGGIVLILMPRFTRKGPYQMTPYAIAPFVAAIAFRVMGIGSGFSAMFVALLVTTSLMGLIHFAYLALVHPAPDLPIWGHAWRVSMLASGLVVVCTVLTLLM
jgi:hypothetical protein